MEYNSSITCPPFDSAEQQGHKPSKESSISVHRSLEFAHPVDAGIIKVLDNRIINEAFNKYVNICVDLDAGLSLATSIKIDETNYPELNSIIEECSMKLSIPKPYVVISRSVSGINARTAGTDDFSYIAVSSLLTLLMESDEQKFVLGHECGHIALGHVVYHTALSTAGSLSGLVPVIGSFVANAVNYPLNAWSRRSEISADRAGLICCGNIDTAKKALLHLEAGFLDVDNLDIDDYLENYRSFSQNSKLGKLREILMSHPVIPKRIEALDLFAHSEKYFRITNRQINPDMQLLSDGELERRTNSIVKVL